MTQKISCSTLILLGFLLLHCPPSEQSSFEKDVTLTSKQKKILDEFRDLVADRLPNEYMKKEIYLIRWLRAKQFDIPEAEKFLMNNLEWRKENNMDRILDEDWSDFNEQFRTEVQGCDKSGRPVVSVRVGEWDVRQAVLSGQSQKMMRYFDKLYEEITTYIRISQERGERVTKYDLLVDLSGYNLVIQGCPLCIPVYVHFFKTYESHFPGMCHRTFVINAPQIFIPLWNILNPFLSEQTRSMISLNGKNPREWKPFLLREIDSVQLTREYGGMKEEAVTPEQLKEDGGHIQCQKYAVKV